MATAAPSVELGPLGLENPMGTDGFEFVEYAAPDPELLRSLFAKMGFPAVARHKRTGSPWTKPSRRSISGVNSPTSIMSPKYSTANMISAATGATVLRPSTAKAPT